MQDEKFYMSLPDMDDMITILDCYTDEPAGLGVPPFLGTYPRYIAGSLDEMPAYITIDDLRAFKRNKDVSREIKPSEKTDIRTYNLTKNFRNIKKRIDDTDELIIIAGVHTPGKYLSAVPGTLKEIMMLTRDIDCKKILTGPAVFGTTTEGGKFFEKADMTVFNKIKNFDFSYEEIRDLSVKGAEILDQIPAQRIIELETSKGCSRAKHCSFCTEPLKHKLSFRGRKDIIKEAEALKKAGARYFRLGKQACYYSHPEAIGIVEDMRKKIDPEVLHIDNANPLNIVSKKGENITKAIVKYCTEGNIAAIGAESFDPEVIRQNNLNSDPEMTYKAVKQLNKYGRERGRNGMPKFLPGINIIFGLIGESKNTNEHNLEWLKRFLDEGLLIRRINIRQVDIFEGTPIYSSAGNKFIKKNKKYYWKWRDQIRREIDIPMLKKIAPEGQILRDIKTEIWDGKNTFARQIGTYPLIVGIKRRLDLGKFVDVRVKSHMLRSVVAEPLSE